ncbi:MAG: tetratricopeptide repeat protein [Balneolaceae bacterium]|nr:tetratricopeptide repeat protein [Balneolaceae bacterium]
MPTHRLCTLFSLTLLLALLSLPLSAQDTRQSDLETYNRGVDLFEQGLYRQAARLLGDFASERPDHQLAASALFYRARALAQDDSARTADYYESFLADHPRSEFSRRLLFELGDKAARDSNFSQAIAYYRRSFDHGLTDAESAQARYWMAEAAVGLGDYGQARSHYLTLADNHPDSEWAPKALYSRGRLYLSENRYDSSTVAFELLRERFPNHEMTRRIGTALGESYYQQGEYGQAIEAFESAMPYLEDELRTKAVYLIAESHNYLNQLDQASKYYLQYINRTRGTDRERQAHYGLGWVYHKQQIYHWSADEFEQAASGDDELARKALYYKAVNEKLGGRYADAMSTFQQFGERYSEGLWVEEAYYEWAITAFEMGDYPQAIEVLLPLVRNEESLDWTGKVYTLLGESYFANKEYTRALQAFEAAEQVTDIDPEIKRQARFQRAWVQYRNQAYEQAQEGFQQVYAEAPSGSELGREALFWSADSYYNRQDYGPASRQYARFINENPDHELNGAARYALGWSYFKMGQYQQAIEPLRTFLNEYEPPSIALYPYDTDTKLRIGDAHYALGQYQEAISAYETAIGAEPGGDYAMFQIGNSYYRNEQTYEAVTTFRRFLRIYPYSTLREQAQYNIAYIYLNTGNYTQAVEEFQTVINKYPNTSWAARSQYNIGDAHYNAGQYDRAVQAYRTVMEEYPESEYIIEAVNGIQYSQLSAGESDSSMTVLEEFLADNPSSSTADRLRYRQAETLLQSGDYEGAVAEFQQYIRVTNNQELLPDAHFNLANAYEQTGNMQQAVASYQTVAEEFPQSQRAAPSLAALGRIHQQRGDYAQAYSFFEKLAGEGGSYVQEAHIGMGNARLAQGQLEAAAGHFESASGDAASVGLAKVELQRQNFAAAEELAAPVAESNSTEIGAEAQYLVGQSRQRRGQYEQALSAYSNVRVLYEAFDTWVARAMLRSAECYIQQGNPGEARNTLNALLDRFPGTPEAREAQRMLESD